jgi:hypothetical protein
MFVIIKTLIDIIWGQGYLNPFEYGFRVIFFILVKNGADFGISELDGLDLGIGKIHLHPIVMPKFRPNKIEVLSELRKSGDNLAQIEL